MVSARPPESQRAIDEWDIDVVHIHSVSSASTTIVVLALFSANYSLGLETRQGEGEKFE